MIKTYLFTIAVGLSIGYSFCQSIKPDKVSHAEPLYYDLVRDLGARKGEKEFNIGTNFTNIKSYKERGFLMEYEFAPINRIGFEAELDFSFYKRTNYTSDIPNNKLEGLRLSTQYSFFVSTKLKATMAIGYTQIIKFVDFKNYGKKDLSTGTVYNPFFIAAKRWGNSFHTLIYTGPLLENNFSTNRSVLNWQINSSFIYTIPKTKHFIGVEFNQEIKNKKLETIIRPQAKIKINKNLAVGFVTGIPVNAREESFSSFLRIIYEL